MINKQKLLKLVSKEKSSTLKKINNRMKSRAMLRESQKIALKTLMRLDELGLTQKNLPTQLKVTPQLVNKIVSSKENPTLESQTKIQEILNIPVLARY